MDGREAAIGEADEQEKLNDESDEARAAEGVGAGMDDDVGDCAVMAVELDVLETMESAARVVNDDEELAGKEEKEEADDGLLLLLLSAMGATEEAVEVEMKKEKADDVDTLIDDEVSVGCTVIGKPCCCCCCCCLHNGEVRFTAAALTRLPPGLRLIVG